MCGDLRRDQHDGARDRATLFDAHLAEVFAVHQLLRAVRGHRELIEIFQLQVFIRHRLGCGFFQTAFFIAALGRVRFGRRTLDLHGLHRHALVSLFAPETIEGHVEYRKIFFLGDQIGP